MADHRATRREFVRDGAAAVAGVGMGMGAVRAASVPPSKILNYNKDMEYRRCGKTGLMVSAVALGGHWKRVDTVVPGLFKGKGWLNAEVRNPDFARNRHDVVSRCMERGINWIDACTGKEVMAYSAALKGRRDKMHLAYSWYEHEMRFPEWRVSVAKMMEGFETGLRQSGLEYVDLWRITMHEQTASKNSEKDVAVAMGALAKAKKQGKARFTGVSSHDRPWLKEMIDAHPDQIDIVVTPYTAKTKKVKDRHGLWAAIKKHNVGWFGIKPFASNSLFKGNSALDSPHRKEDDRRARLAIRYILCNDAITAPIPGMINTAQVDNVAEAVKERRRLDLAEAEELRQAADEAWAKLPEHYQWLKDWEYV